MLWRHGINSRQLTVQICRLDLGLNCFHVDGLQTNGAAEDNAETGEGAVGHRGQLVAMQAIGRSGSAGLDQIAGPVGEALVMTAAGLAVAIPAVLAFNYLSGRADQLTLALERARGEFLDHLEVSGPTMLPVSHSEDRSRAPSTPAGVELSAVS